MSKTWDVVSSFGLFALILITCKLSSCRANEEPKKAIVEEGNSWTLNCFANENGGWTFDPTLDYKASPEDRQVGEMDQLCLFQNTPS